MQGPRYQPVVHPMLPRTGSIMMTLIGNGRFIGLHRRHRSYGRLRNVELAQTSGSVDAP